MNPPNIREVDCCANCEYSNDMVAQVLCEMYGYKRYINICDDFKREE